MRGFFFFRNEFKEAKVGGPTSDPMASTDNCLISCQIRNEVFDELEACMTSEKGKPLGAIFRH